MATAITLCQTGMPKLACPSQQAHAVALPPSPAHSSSCRSYFQVPAHVAKLGWVPADAPEVDRERNRNVKSLSRH